MPVIRLQNASLERNQLIGDLESNSTSSSSKSSFNLLDAIKKSSSKTYGEFRKRIPVDPTAGKTAHLAFTSLTESLSQSSGELTEALANSFSLFRASSSQRKSEEEEIREDDSMLKNMHRWEAFPGFPEERDIWSPTDQRSDFLDRTHDLLDQLGGPKSPPNQASRASISSALYSVPSTDSEGSDFDGEGTANGGHSLFDRLGSKDSEDDEVTDEESDDEENFDDDSPRSQESAFDEFREVEDGLAVIGNVMYELGTCNFNESLLRNEVDFEDDYSVDSDVFPALLETITPSRGRSLTPRSISSIPSWRQAMNDLAPIPEKPTHGIDREKTPKASNQSMSFLESMFSCTG